MKISQREARRLRKRVKELESAENSRRNQWAAEYPGGANIASVKVEAGGGVAVAIKTARLLNHAVVVTADDTWQLRFFALPLPSK